jgi:hypothetical protein
MSLPSWCDIGSPIGAMSSIKSTQNSIASSVAYPFAMIPSGWARLRKYFLRPYINLSKGNMLCKYLATRIKIYSTRWTRKVGHDSKEGMWNDHLKADEAFHDIILHLLEIAWMDCLLTNLVEEC